MLIFLVIYYKRLISRLLIFEDPICTDAWQMPIKYMPVNVLYIWGNKDF